ncbi:MAG: GNAT family N-acetyltransferase [Ignavibacteria bacterium]|nr:GNAT family N-acetyltransferase [Ignavibacteria bacterium]
MTDSICEIKVIPSGETRHLRKINLRPAQNEDELFYPGDDDEETVHFGLFCGNELCGIASLYKECMSGETNDFSWRLRGMATNENVRGKGFGSKLMNRCIEHIKSKNGKKFWCNARTTAEKFYEKFGMKRYGEVFFPEGLGEHIVMKMEINNQNKI